MKHRITFLCLICCFLLGCTIRYSDKKIDVNQFNSKIVYYETFKKGKVLPVEPIGIIPQRNALLLKSYCIGYYNEKNQLVAIEKYLMNELFFRFEYCYHENGKLWKTKSWNEHGKIQIHEYDKKR
jgi:hypothetical protein